MDFIETMAQYLDGYRQDVWDVAGHKKKLDRIEARYPGFTERYNNFGKEVDGFREETNEEAQDIVLVKLLREGFILDGIFEEDNTEQLRLKLNQMYDRARVFKAEDIGLTRKEE